MTTQARPAAARAWPTHTGKDGRVHETTGYHWLRGRLIVCPVCGMGPCDGDCPEQLITPPPGSPADRAIRRARGEAVEIAPAVAPAVVGNGNPDVLVAAAFAEAAQRKRETREDAGEGS